MNTRTKRRKRRRAKARLKNPSAVRKHAKRGGRTGSIRKTPADRVFFIRRIPNPPFGGQP